MDYVMLNPQDRIGSMNERLRALESEAFQHELAVATATAIVADAATSPSDRSTANEALRAAQAAIPIIVTAHTAVFALRQDAEAALDAAPVPAAAPAPSPIEGG